MLTFCGFLILMLIGFMFVKEDNKKKIIKLMKEKATLIGAGLVLLFLINGISGYGNMSVVGRNMLTGSTLNDKSDLSSSDKGPFSNIGGLSQEMEGFEQPRGSTCGGP